MNLLLQQGIGAQRSQSGLIAGCANACFPASIAILNLLGTGARPASQNQHLLGTLSSSPGLSDAGYYRFDRYQM